VGAGWGAAIAAGICCAAAVAVVVLADGSTTGAATTVVVGSPRIVVATVVGVSSTDVGTAPTGIVVEFDVAPSAPVAAFGSGSAWRAGSAAFSEPMNGTIAANPAAAAAVMTRLAWRAGCGRRRIRRRR
jgi:hypothetical protein